MSSRYNNQTPHNTIVAHLQLIKGSSCKVLPQSRAIQRITKRLKRLHKTSKLQKENFLNRKLPLTDRDRTYLKMLSSFLRSFFIICPRYLKLSTCSNITPSKWTFGWDCHFSPLKRINIHTVLDTLYMIKCSDAKFWQTSSSLFKALAVGATRARSSA